MATQRYLNIETRTTAIASSPLGNCINHSLFAAHDEKGRKKIVEGVTLEDFLPFESLASAADFTARSGLANTAPSAQSEA